MNIIQKKEFIVNHLVNADESIVDILFQTMQKEEQMKLLLTQRALKSEEDIQQGRVFTKEEIIEKLKYK